MSSVANAGQLRIRVDDSRNDFVIHVPAFAGDHLHARDSFFLRLVRQHRARDDIADRVNTFDVGFEMLVDFDSATIVHRDFDGVAEDPFRKRAPAH
jgi:hypothetical protein